MRLLRKRIFTILSILTALIIFFYSTITSAVTFDEKISGWECVNTEDTEVTYEIPKLVLDNGNKIEIKINGEIQSLNSTRSFALQPGSHLQVTVIAGPISQLEGIKLIEHYVPRKRPSSDKIEEASEPPQQRQRTVSQQQRTSIMDFFNVANAKCNSTVQSETEISKLPTKRKQTISEARKSVEPPKKRTRYQLKSKPPIALPKLLLSTPAGAPISSPHLFSNDTSSKDLGTPPTTLQDEFSESAKKRGEVQKEAEEGLKNVPLTFYLLKNPEKLPPISEVPEEIQKRLKGFPWQFLNADKLRFIGLPHEGKNYFIDGQLYSEIKDSNGEEIYVFQETGIHKTRWVETVHAQVEKHKDSEKTRYTLYEGAQYKEPKGAVVFIKKIFEKEEKFFAVTFGTGRYLLNLDYCDPNFGKHYAYNILSSNPEYKAQAFSEIDIDEKKLKSEQAKLNAKVEVARGVRAFIPRGLTVKDKNGRRVLCSFSRAHIYKNSKFAFETIGDRCKELLETSERLDYREKYEHIDHFLPIEDKVKINKIFYKAFSGEYDIEPPFEVGGSSDTQTMDVFELSSQLSLKTHFPTLPGNCNDFAMLSNSLKAFIKSHISDEKLLEKLKKLKVLAKDDSNYPVGTWRTDQLVTATVEIDGKAYWIEGGEVFEVHRDFIELINRSLDEHFIDSHSVPKVLPPSSSLRMLGPFTEEDKGQEKNYCKRMADTKHEYFSLFDRIGTIRVDSDTDSTKSSTEACDLLSNGENHFIYIKRWDQGASGKMSYLPIQVQCAAKLLIEDEKYREKFINLLPQGKRETMRDVLRQKTFNVVMAIIHKNKDDNFIPSTLPFNVKMALYKGILEVEKLGLKCIIVCIKDESPPKSKSKSKKESSSDSAAPDKNTPGGSNASVPPSQLDQDSASRNSESKAGKASGKLDNDGNDKKSFSSSDGNGVSGGKKYNFPPLTEEQREKANKFLETISERYINAIGNAYQEEREVLWGGDIELIEVANLRNLRITVYHPSTEGPQPNPQIGPIEGRPVNLWLEGGHYENYDQIKDEHTLDVPRDGNCLFHAVLRAEHDLNDTNTIYKFKLEAVANLRNQVADNLRYIVERVRRGDANPIYARFAAIFEAENNEQLATAIAYLPHGSLREEAVGLLTSERTQVVTNLTPSIYDYNYTLTYAPEEFRKKMKLFDEMSLQFVMAISSLDKKSS